MTVHPPSHHGPQERVFGLDLLRALAILAVVAAHGAQFFLVRVQDHYREWGVFAALGVFAFFVLSGFLIGGLVLRAAVRAGPQGRWLGWFWIRRWFRTLPNYYLWLFINIAIVAAGLAPALYEPTYLFFTQNLASAPPLFFVESWSLAVEEVFYLVFPLIVLAGMSWRLRPSTAVAAAGLVLVAVPLVLRVVAVADGAFTASTLDKGLVYQLHGIGIGTLAAWLASERPAAWARLRRPGALVGPLLVAIGAAGWFDLNYLQALEGAAAQANGILAHATIYAGVALLLPFLVQLRAPAGATAAAVTHVSLVSYSWYLAHIPMARLVHAASPPRQIDAWPGALMEAGGWFVASLLVSVAMYHLFEKRMTGLRERWARTRHVPPVPSTGGAASLTRPDVVPAWTGAPAPPAATQAAEPAQDGEDDADHSLARRPA